MSWGTRPYEADDFDGVRDLYRATFGAVRPVDHDRWKYEDNPDGQRIAVVATDGEAIVGQYALWPVSLRLGSDVMRGAQSLDTMTHPAYRGQGMFTRLANETFDLAKDRGVVALYGFPNEASYPGFVRRLNWDHTGGIPRWVRPLKPSDLTAMPGARVLNPLGGVVLDRGGSADVVVQVPSDSEIEAVLAHRHGQPNRCQVDRTVQWMRWRFAEGSRRDYRWVVARRGGDPVGIAVWGYREDGHAVLSELIALDTEALRAIVNGAVKDAYQSGAPAMHSITNIDGSVSALRRAGFIRRGSAPLIVRKLTHRTLGANVHDHEAWSIVGADIDTY